MMKEDDDNINVYELIASTSDALKRAIRKYDSGVKYSKSVVEITENLKNAYDCRETVKVMKNFIQKYGKKQQKNI